jgi:hypothetical protein
VLSAIARGVPGSPAGNALTGSVANEKSKAEDTHVFGSITTSGEASVS